MYTVEKTVQIIISLLKEYGVKNLVLSPGSRNVPFVHSVEQDSYFDCYSIVDERSAAYFALGLAEKLDEPVALSCTSSTASSNYFPAIMEAYNKGIKLVILTADRNPYYKGQMENQMIEQPDMYGNFCVVDVDLPTVHNINDKRYCERLVNQALWGVVYSNIGPIHINYPIYGNHKDFSVKQLPVCRKIELVTEFDQKNKWVKKINDLKNCKRIMFLFGESGGYTKEVEELLSAIFERYNCIFSVEHMSNLHCEGTLRTFLVTESMNSEDVKQFLPDILVTFGANFASDYKGKLRNNAGSFRHWRVNTCGDIVDTFMSLDTVFKCSDRYFLYKLLQESEASMVNNIEYYSLWKNRINSLKWPDLGYTNFYAIGMLMNKIPPNAIIHLSILNSIRLSQFFDLPESVSVYANIGAYGIDGSLSTFLGQAYNRKDLAFLVVGDLSYFYDTSAMFSAPLKSNVRLFLINNHGGGEFHYAYHNAGFDNIDKHISAGHHSSAESLVTKFDMEYMCAVNREQLMCAIEKFVDKRSDRPIMLEVFTDLNNDADKLIEFLHMNSNISFHQKVIKKIKNPLIKIRKMLKSR